MNTSQLFPTSVVGSLPRPDYVKDLINDAVPVAPEEYRRLMGLAVSSAVALQEAAGPRERGRVLVVDDESVVAHTLKVLLQGEHELVVAVHR